MYTDCDLGWKGEVVRSPIQRRCGLDADDGEKGRLEDVDNAMACGGDEMPSTLGGRRKTLQTVRRVQSTMRLLHTGDMHNRQGTTTTPIPTCDPEREGWKALLATRWERQWTAIAARRSPEALQPGSG